MPLGCHPNLRVPRGEQELRATRYSNRPQFLAEILTSRVAVLLRAGTPGEHFLALAARASTARAPSWEIRAVNRQSVPFAASSPRAARGPEKYKVAVENRPSWSPWIGSSVASKSRIRRCGGIGWLWRNKLTESLFIAPSSLIQPADAPFLVRYPGYANGLVGDKQH